MQVLHVQQLEEDMAKVIMDVLIKNHVKTGYGDDKIRHITITCDYMMNHDVFIKNLEITGLYKNQKR